MKPWQDPDHPGNKIRPNLYCIGCGTKGVITSWGKWCFKCNVERMTLINATFDSLRTSLKKQGG
jgi:hypothetical protein